MKPDETIFIPLGAVHRIENPYKKPVKKDEIANNKKIFKYLKLIFSFPQGKKIAIGAKTEKRKIIGITVMV